MLSFRSLSSELSTSASARGISARIPRPLAGDFVLPFVLCGVLALVFTPGIVLAGDGGGGSGSASGGGSSGGSSSGGGSSGGGGGGHSGGGQSGGGHGGGGPGLPDWVAGEIPAIDGFGNSIADPLRGAAGVPFIRLLEAAYDDGANAPAGSDRPSPRLISNLVCAQDGLFENADSASDFLWQWGQFLDHDIDETPLESPAEPFDIPVPLGDPWFDPTGSGTQLIPLDRSHYEIVGGVRQQVNEITAFIDASQVYGSDAARAAELRTLDGTGRLKTSAGDLLPFNVNGFPNAPAASDPSFFLAGDIRANEQVGLAVMHTLFVREHNYWAERWSEEDSSLSGEEIYQRSRAIVAAEMQWITVNEFLPLLLGPSALGPYAGYDPSVDPGIRNEFATASYRVGHTLLSPTLLRLRANGSTAPEGDLSLADAFFAPEELSDHGIESVLRGLAAQRAQEVDPFIIEDVRNFLFGPPGAGGFDLASLNLQRGRDHGLPGYAAARVGLGLSAVTTFADISSDPGVQARLASAYDSVEDIDLWVGGLCEDHLPEGMVGETIAAILTLQFRALRDGDRFWYQNAMSADWQDLIEEQTLREIIQRNTSIGSELPHDVFRVGSSHFVRGDCDRSGAMNLSDAIRLLEGLFFQHPMGCLDACDVDDSGAVTVSDAIHCLSALFLGSDPPSAPYPNCGADSAGPAGGDGLSCDLGTASCS